MRVAMFTGCFPLVSETFILRQITGLLDLGHEVDVYAETRPDGGHPVHPEVEAYRLLDRTTYMDVPEEAGYWEMPLWPLTGQTWVPGATRPMANIGRACRALPALVRCLWRAPALTLKLLDPRHYGHQARSGSALYRLAGCCARRRRYDVLHCHFGPVANTFRFSRQLFGVPFVATFHGYDFCAWPRGHGHDVYRHLFEVTDAVTVNSDYAGQRVRELGCATEKIHLLRVGLDPDDFPFRERRLLPGAAVRLLSIGRLVEKKGLEYAIRAVGLVRQSHPELRYEIIGDGPLRSRLEALIRELGLESVVTLLGGRDGMYVRQRMAEADIFILPSVTAADGDQEGTPVSLMEAQASGLPVLSTRHSGIPEIVRDGESGFLLPERDIEGLAGRLAYLIGNPECWAAMGRSGRDLVERSCDIRTLNRQLVGLYETLRPHP
jgi:colanic acid/amylovoran biosynthesis glycosyltransferase